MAKRKAGKPGRPRHYETPEAFEQKANEYFEQCKEESKRPLVTGLALFMGFSSRAELHGYMNYDGFSNVVKKALTMVEMSYEQNLYSATPSGSIFALKNMGWSDKQEVDHTSSDGSMGGNVNIEVTIEDIKSVLSKI